MSLKDTTNSIQSCLDVLKVSPDVDKEDQAKLLDACGKLKAALESPVDSLTRVLYGVFQSTALRLAKDMGLFNALAAAGDQLVTVEELASQTKADPVLIIRIMRLLVGMDLVNEASTETYAPSPLIGLLKDGSPYSDAVQHFGPITEGVAKLPAYFARNGYHNPSDANNGPFQFALGTDQHFFKWLENQPQSKAAFNTVMRMTARNLGQGWYEYYPVEQRLQVEDLSLPALVDIGGGTGQMVAALKAKYPNLKGRVILQDLPDVIDDIKEPLSGIEAMKYDFFDPQPVQAARAYYLRTVLHDWPDKQALQILANVKTAMSGHSFLLINEQVLPDRGVSLVAAQSDIAMMVQFASMERTQQQWVQLLDSAGFEVIKVWHPSEHTTGEKALFEAKVKA